MWGGPDRPGQVGREPRPVPVEVPPLDVDGVRAVQVGTALWGVAVLALLPFYSLLAESGRLWWLWTCTAGLSMGLFGIEYCRRRRDAPAREVPTRTPSVRAPKAPKQKSPKQGTPRQKSPKGGRRRA